MRCASIVSEADTVAEFSCIVISKKESTKTLSARRGLLNALVRFAFLKNCVCYCNPQVQTIISFARRINFCWYFRHSQAESPFSFAFFQKAT